jgi:DNA-directed RNA polymerase specialized sigma24 family protein
MTTTERNELLVSLLEQQTPFIKKCSTAYGLDFEEAHQEAAVLLLHLLERDLPNKPGERAAYIRSSIKYRLIDKVRYAQRHPALSLDMPIYADQDGNKATLADLLPSPYRVEPLAVILAKERIEAALNHLAIVRLPNAKAGAARRLAETALASLGE